MSSRSLGVFRIKLDSVDSTNNYAAKMLELPNCEHGTVILAEEQTNGRGQFGRIWDGESANNLYSSIILHTQEIPLDKVFCLNAAFSVAVAQTVADFTSKPAFVKWPNDIICDNHKVSGILIENSIFGSNLKSTIIGFGMNVNQKHFHHPNAASIFSISGKTNSIEQVLNRILENFESLWDSLVRGDYDMIINKYNDLLWKKNQTEEFQVSNAQIKAKILSVNDSGQLNYLHEGIQKHTSDSQNFKLIW